MDSAYPISISPESGEPLANQIHRQLTWLITSRFWKPGETLPSIRSLARQLGINMLTVRSAYQRLEKDGLVKTRQGAGTRVIEFTPGTMLGLAVRSRSYTIGVILPGMSDPFYHDFLQGVQQGISRENLLLFVCDAHENQEEMIRDFNQLAARNVDGIIVASYDIHPLLGTMQSKAVPFVTVDSPGCVGPVVNFDLEDAAWQAVHHLLQHGYRKIGMVTFSEEVANVNQMRAGYIRALYESGIPINEELIARVPGFDVDNGERGAQALLSLEHPPEAIFTASDTQALGVYRYAKSLGKQIPNDLAVASLDDIFVASLVEPGLTTVSLPARQLGLEAINMLLRLIAGERLDANSLTLPSRLVIRRSCGCMV